MHVTYALRDLRHLKRVEIRNQIMILFFLLFLCVIFEYCEGVVNEL